MSRRHYRLPPLSALASFETAARIESFKGAAVELNVTPGAVSHQIKALEAEIGVNLFERKYRGVELTENGRILYHALQRSFSDISSALGQLRRSIDSKSVTVSATTAMSSLWLTPRLTRFWKQHGDIAVNQLVSDTGLNHGETPDLRIQFGSDSEEKSEHNMLFRDKVIAVCSPERLPLYKDIGINELAKEMLIHLEAKDKRWITWKTWLKEFGYEDDIAQGLKVNNYTIALQAAQDGAGIVLGWKRLIQPLLDKGQLAQIGSYSMSAPNRFYIVSESSEKLSKNSVILRDWLLKNI